MLQSPIKPTDPRGELIKEASIIIWDEGPMVNRAVLACVEEVSILFSFEMCQGPDVGGRLTKGLVLYISMHCDVVSCADIIHIFRCHVRQMQTRTHCDVVSAVRTFHALCNVVSNMRIDDAATGHQTIETVPRPRVRMLYPHCGYKAPKH